MSTPSIQRPTTTAFFVQAALSFGLVFVVSSAFTLAKCVRDRQEVEEVTNRVDKARIDKLLIEQDVFKPGV
ncbi:hypothetical protein [Streptomyces sclerotialus]|uniref:hypothetical protein n=1 Tax=Streptomyces sclerotialus TaxID=1957 RepID=UPI0004CA3F44